MTTLRMLIALALLALVLACGSADAGLKGYAQQVRPAPLRATMVPAGP